MKICFIIGSMSFSGAEKVLSILMKELHSKGNEVYVILLNQDKNIIGNEDGIITYGAKATGGKIGRVLSRWKNIRKNVKTINPEIVVSFGSVCNVNMLPALIGVNVKKVVCERNDPKHDPRKKSEKLIRKITYPLADGYVFQTEEIKKYFSNKIQYKSVVIPNPIIDSGIRWNKQECKKSVITVARLDDYQKDQIVMFKAFMKFSEIESGYTLDVYGDGPDKEQYQKFINENGLEEKIILHGKSNNPLHEIAKSEIFLLTSKYEGMPNALMEAMSIGIPCVSTDCGGGGAKALFSMVEEGLIAKVGDEKDIAMKLKEMVDNEKKYIEISDNLIKINEILSPEKISVKWTEFFKQMIS